MALWILAVLSSLLCTAHGLNKLTVASENGNAFYRDEPLYADCFYSLSSIEKSAISGFGISLSKLGASGQSISEFFGCGVNRIAGAEQVNKLDPAGFLLTSPTREECFEIYSSFTTGGSAVMRLNFTLTVLGNYTCAIWTTQARQDSNVITISSLKVAPIKISSSVLNGEAFYEGDPVNFFCNSTGGTPTPSWLYGKGSTALNTTRLRFNATKADDKLYLSCRDLSHSEFRGGNTSRTQLNVLIRVYYLSARHISTNVTYSKSREHSILCETDNFLADNASLSFVWNRNGTTVQNITTSQLLVTHSPEITSEVVMCEAYSNDTRIRSVNSTFIIEWVDEPTNGAGRLLSTATVSFVLSRLLLLILPLW